ncbi:MAG: hypothetical protein ABII82_04155 [Verrucomicrobiota bacterium]
MKRYLHTLVLLIVTSSALAANTRSNYPGGDFENGRGRWNLVEGVKVTPALPDEYETHGRQYLKFTLGDGEPAKVQLEFKIKRPFERIMIKLDMYLSEGTKFSASRKPPIHFGIRNGSAMGAFLGHRYLLAKDLKEGAWVTVEKEITWDSILPASKKSKDPSAVFEIELLQGEGSVLVDNIEVVCE